MPQSGNFALEPMWIVSESSRRDHHPHRCSKPVEVGPKGTLTYGPLQLQRRVILLASSWPNMLLHLEQHAWAEDLETAEASSLSTEMRTQSQQPSIWLRSPCTRPGMVLRCYGINKDDLQPYHLRPGFTFKQIQSGQILPPNELVNTFGFQGSLNFWTTSDSLWPYTIISTVRMNKLRVRKVREFGSVYISVIQTQFCLVLEPMFFFSYISPSPDHRAVFCLCFPVSVEQP